jgi:Cof subfamily protein (haloacid dehalogenase superfamily)
VASTENQRRGGEGSIRLLALDIDGTLLNSRHELTPNVRSAVQEAGTRGVEIVLTSARGPSGLKIILRQLGIRGYSVAFSGALVCRTGPDQPAEAIAGDRMDLAAARVVAQRGRELGVSVGWWDFEEWFVPELDGPATYEAGVIGVPPIVRDLSRLEAPPFKLQCMTSMEHIDRLRALRDDCPEGLTGHFSNPNYLEVLSTGTDKARGLLRLGAALGIEPAQMAAIGDGENDLTMLKAVGLGVAVANARPSVQAAAAWITGSNDEDGVASAIERMQHEGRI